ncbi:hypothetical protein CUMW_216930 [Citrus unshiu]|uniref:FAF domain-containing protein n=1 Tax=Citrus unshiu TaxID=55188 RepID=A0A2H5QCG4_CITUN|nr:hypothetical protein CUMW_216930 [Citrus unshiu]
MVAYGGSQETRHKTQNTSELSSSSSSNLHQVSLLCHQQLAPSGLFADLCWMLLHFLRSFRLSSTLKIEEEAMVITKNQGIGSILGSDTCDERSTNSSSSLRRTLSADHMSSTKWLTQHGFSPMKKIASSEEFSICSIADSSSSEDEEEEDSDETNIDEPRSQFDIWSSIQEEVAKKKELDHQKQGQFDIWSSIIHQKSQEITYNKPLPPPYIHPLVKRSASSLTEKSLEICTESLGSETGSEGFSSYPASESGDDDKETEQEQQERVEQSLSFAFEAMSIPKYNYVVGRKPLAQQRQRSFPPPIPSRGNGASSIRMQSRRDNGRLVLEAVSVPSTNNFLAQRQNGRLVLTFVNTNRDPTWPNKFNEVVKFDEVENDIKPTILAKSLPPMPRMIPKARAVAEGDGTETATEAAVVAAAGGGGGCAGGGVSFNAYEYYWRPKPMTAAQSKGGGSGGNNNNINHNDYNNKLILSKNSMGSNSNQEQQQLLVLRGNKGDYWVPSVKSCKEPRRSLLFWEPYCIATS